MRRAKLRWNLFATIVVSASSAGTQAQQCQSPSPLTLPCVEPPVPPIVCPNPDVEGCWGNLLDIDRPADPPWAARHMVLLRNEKLLLVEAKALLIPAEVRLWEPPDIEDPDPCSRGTYTEVSVPHDL